MAVPIENIPAEMRWQEATILYPFMSKKHSNPSLENSFRVMAESTQLILNNLTDRVLK